MQYSSLTNASVIFMTSIPTYTTKDGSIIWSVAHNHMQRLLEMEYHSQETEVSVSKITAFWGTSYLDLWYDSQTRISLCRFMDAIQDAILMELLVISIGSLH
jgi:hypothetical protein